MAQKDEAAEAAESPAIANPILNDYFLKQYYTTRGLPEPEETTDEVYSDSAPKEPADPMAELYVKWQIKRFLENLNRETDGLKSALSEAKEARDALRSRPGDADSTRQLWKQALTKVSEHASQLSRMLGNVLADLEADRRFKAEAAPEGPDLFEKQSAFLEEEAQKAVSGVKALFLQPTNVVGIEELKGENVLAQLNRVQKLSKEIGKAL